MNFARHINGPLVGLAVLSSVNPVASATTVELETNAYEAILRVEAGAYAGTLEFTRNSDDAEPRIRTLPAPLRHVDDVRVAHGKLLVIGTTNQFNDLLVIYDLASLELLDVILCRELALSPAGRFAVFERFFPRDAPERYVQHLTLLYDVSATPQQNRLPGVPVPSFENSPWSIDAGYPIYPPPPLEGSRPYMLPATVAKERKARGHTPPYAWSHDERRIAYVVHHPAEASWETKILVVEIGDDGRPLSRETIDVVHDFGAPIIELEFVNRSIRFARKGDHGTLMIRVVDPE